MLFKQHLGQRLRSMIQEMESAAEESSARRASLTEGWWMQFPEES
jgi:hypothetical protein